MSDNEGGLVIMRIALTLPVKEFEIALESAKNKFLSGDGKENITIDINDNVTRFLQENTNQEDMFNTVFFLSSVTSEIDPFSDIKYDYSTIITALRDDNRALKEVVNKVVSAVSPNEYCGNSDKFNGYNIRGICEGYNGHEKVIIFSDEDQMFTSYDMDNCVNVRVEYQDKVIGVWRPVNFVTEDVNPETTFLIPCKACTIDGDIIAAGGVLTNH